MIIDTKTKEDMLILFGMMQAASFWPLPKQGDNSAYAFGDFHDVMKEMYRDILQRLEVLQKD